MLVVASVRFRMTLTRRSRIRQHIATDRCRGQSAFATRPHEGRGPGIGADSRGARGLRAKRLCVVDQGLGHGPQLSPKADVVSLIR